MQTLDERIEALRHANDADGEWINVAEMHRLALDLAAERERLREALQSIANIGIAWSHSPAQQIAEAQSIARAALAAWDASREEG